MPTPNTLLPLIGQDLITWPHQTSEGGEKHHVLQAAVYLTQNQFSAPKRKANWMGWGTRNLDLRNL